MTKDELRTRRELLLNERAQLVARVQMYEGALEECEYWLRKAESEDEAAKGENGPAAGGHNGSNDEVPVGQVGSA